jgi:hypothetical protein
MDEEKQGLVYTTPLTDIIGLIFDGCTDLVESVRLIVEQKMLRKGCVPFHIEDQIISCSRTFYDKISRLNVPEDFKLLSRTIKDYCASIETFLKNPYRVDQIKDMLIKQSDKVSQSITNTHTLPPDSVMYIQEFVAESRAIYEMVLAGRQLYPYL